MTSPAARAPGGTRPVVGLSISIDTEEDNWIPSLEGITVRNIREIPRLAELFATLGVRATYFVTYQVASTPESASVIRDLASDGSVEIGAHLHPWNTPPSCGLEPRISMLRDYPIEFQRKKLERLLAEFDTSIGIRPTSFRAGRFGVGRSVIEALVENGIYVDSSVTPLISWEGDGGPSFLDAPTRMYRLDGRGDVPTPSDTGPVVEVPVTVGFTRFDPATWPRLARLLAAARGRGVRLFGLASRLGLFRRVILSPETHTVDDMLQISRRLVEAGEPYLHLYFHSSSLVPGLSQFVRTEEDRVRLYDTVKGFVEGLREFADVRPCTVTEAAEAFGPSAVDAVHAVPGPIAATGGAPGASEPR